MLATRVSLRFTPRPATWLIRRLFARSGRRTGEALLARAPADVIVTRDLPYAGHPDTVLDVYSPAREARPGFGLPTVVWIHGGAFVGGDKRELEGYLRMVADAGFTVVAVGYSLAPEEIYPVALRQVMAALGHLQANTERLQVDPSRLVIAGDSAGAHLAAQLATLVTSDDYVSAVGIAPTVGIDELRGVVLCSGIFRLTGLSPSSPFDPFLRAVLWAYSGDRDAAADGRFATTTDVVDQVTAAFPPTFVTAGNADPLAPQSTALVERLGALGVEVDALLYPGDHEPPLGHEYQFDPDLVDARAAFDRIVAFLRRCTDT